VEVRGLSSLRESYTSQKLFHVFIEEGRAPLRLKSIEILLDTGGILNSSSRTHRKSKSLYGADPFIVNIFREFLRNWRWFGSMIYAKPKKAKFQHLLFEPRFFGFTETKWYITALYEAIKEEKMDEEARKLYRKLKGTECELSSRRYNLLFKQYFFKSHELLEELRTIIPTIAISEELSKALNENQQIIALIKTLRPSEMTITLNSIPPEYQPFISSREILLQGMRAFYEKPTNITWNIRVCKVFNRGLFAKRNATETFQLLNQVSSVLKKMMSKYHL
jgi:hypothetical protein